MVAMAEGTASPSFFLSSFDPGLGKTTVLIHFARHRPGGPSSVRMIDPVPLPTGVSMALGGSYSFTLQLNDVWFDREGTCSIGIKAHHCNQSTSAGAETTAL
jgi:hypothetical protein